MMEKVSELDVTNLLALSWSISLLISKYNYPIPDQFKKIIIQALPNKLEIDKKGEIPTICFSISNYAETTDSELEQMIKDKVHNYSETFCIIFIKNSL